MKSEIETACVVFSLVIIIIFILAFSYNKNIENEQFLNYQDTKTKTMNWCNKMKGVGLLTNDQLNSCLSTYNDATTGVMPKAVKPPSTGMERGFSLYNSRLTTLSPSILEQDNTNNIMLINNDGYYLGCRSDNNVYFAKNINDTSINQKELIFNLVAMNNNVYAIMSSYGKYLIINPSTNTQNDPSIPKSTSSSSNSWCASFTGTKIGPMVSWTIHKYDSESENAGGGNGSSSARDTANGESDVGYVGNIVKMSFESVKLTNFYLSTSINGIDNTLIINYGNDDSNIWKSIPKINKTTDISYYNQKKEFDDKKIKVMDKIINAKTKIMGINALIDILNRLINIINVNYTSIKASTTNSLNVINNKNNLELEKSISELENTIKSMTLPTIPNIDSSNDDDSVSYGSGSFFKSLMKQVQKKKAEEQMKEQLLLIKDRQGEILNLEEDQQKLKQKLKEKQIKQENDKTIILKTISDMQTYYIDKITSDINSISSLTLDARKIESDSETEYNSFLNTLTDYSNSKDIIIKNNITIINNIQYDFNKLNGDYAYYYKEKNKIKEIDKTSNLNIDLITKYSNNNSTLTKIYPVVIFIITLILLYLLYITYKTFMQNVYYDYYT